MILAEKMIMFFIHELIIPQVKERIVQASDFKLLKTTPAHRKLHVYRTFLFEVKSEASS